MNSKENELFALYNEMEGEFFALKKIIDDREALEEYMNGTRLSQKFINLIKNAGDFRLFLSDCVMEKISPYEIVEVLFASKYKHESKLSFVVSALRATESPEFIEVADKLIKCGNRNIDVNREAKIACIVLEKVISGYSSYPLNPIKLSDKREVWGKKYTVRSELRRINASAKKEDRKRMAAVNKYRNISSMSVSKLYREMIQFFRDRDISFGPLHLESNIRQAVLTNRHEFLDFLYDTKELSFVRSQKLGKIR